MWSKIESVSSSSLNLGFGLAKRWLWSKSETGQRFAAVWGNGDSHWRPAPVLRAAFRDQGLRAIACGVAHTLFLTETGRVYATGLNDFGQLGISDDATYSTLRYSEPMEVSGLSQEIVQISAGYYHSGAITGLDFVVC
ncbi:Regulator of chromosome condensation [Trema orientale]|uniref:Regulator of chromosome condensation n=1 Tax=Trema orientale TaxID=63057 RepID=A0A2P5C6J6_TREOI|nr:Regulator of chromosome condensation [Trema orientale]